MPKNRRAQSSAAVLVTLLVAVSASRVRSSGNEPARIHWKQIPEAQLKLDGKTPLTWNVYQSNKKKESNLVLVLLGHRYLALDTKAKLVYSVLPTDLHADGKDFDSDNLMQETRTIPSTEWIEHDIGPAESIRLKLGDYGRILEVQLPHMPDLRGLY